MKKLMMSISVLLVSSAIDVDAMRKIETQHQGGLFNKTMMPLIKNEMEQWSSDGVDSWMQERTGFERQQLELYRNLYAIQDTIFSMISSLNLSIYISSKPHIYSPSFHRNGYDVLDIFECKRDIEERVKEIQLATIGVQDIDTEKKLSLERKLTDIASRINSLIWNALLPSWYEALIVNKLSHTPIQSIPKVVYGIIHTELNILQEVLEAEENIEKQRLELLNDMNLIKMNFLPLLPLIGGDQKASPNEELKKIIKSVKNDFESRIKQLHSYNYHLSRYRIDILLNHINEMYAHLDNPSHNTTNKQQNKERDDTLGMRLDPQFQRTLNETECIYTLANINYASQIKKELEPYLSNFTLSEHISDDQINYICESKIKVDILIERLQKLDPCLKEYYNYTFGHIKGYLNIVSPVMIKAISLTKTSNLYNDYASTIYNSADRYGKIVQKSMRESPVKDRHISWNKKLITALNYIESDMNFFFLFFSSESTSNIDTFLYSLKEFTPKNGLTIFLDLLKGVQNNKYYQENFMKLFTYNELFIVELTKRCQKSTKNILSINSEDYCKFIDVLYFFYRGKKEEREYFYEICDIIKEGNILEGTTRASRYYERYKARLFYTEDIWIKLGMD